MVPEKGTAGEVSLFVENEPRPDLVNGDAIVGPRKGNYLYGKCRFFLSIFKWFPVLFIFSVLGWGYYAYVIQLCLFTMENMCLKILFITVFHFLYIMSIWSYLKTIFTKSKPVQKQYWLTHSEYNRLLNEPSDDAKNAYLQQILNQKGLSVTCRTFTGAIRFCSKCNLIKPDRAHHCSVCQKCVPKMDHHCPWVNNCVSFYNYKYFILFLGYSFFMCLFSGSTSFSYSFKFWFNQQPTFEKFNILFLFFVSVMFSISLFSLFSYHVYLVLLNRSTLESFSPPLFTYGPNKNAFNLGKLRNFKQVFGNKKMLWFFPLYSSIGEGLSYPTSQAHSIQMQRTLPQQQLLSSTSLGHGTVVQMDSLAERQPSIQIQMPTVQEKNDAMTNGTS